MRFSLTAALFATIAAAHALSPEMIKRLSRRHHLRHGARATPQTGLIEAFDVSTQSLGYLAPTTSFSLRGYYGLTTDKTAAAIVNPPNADMQIVFVDTKTPYSYPYLDLQAYSGGNVWEPTNGAYGYFTQGTEIPAGSGTVDGSETDIFALINGTTTIRATWDNGGKGALTSLGGWTDHSGTLSSVPALFFYNQANDVVGGTADPVTQSTSGNQAVVRP